MNAIYVLGALVLGAYILQVIFGLKQIKHFNAVYQMLRRQGKVAIGRYAGKIKAGTIVMFAVDEEGIIIDAVKMQGVTVMAKFKRMPRYLHLAIESLTPDHEVVKQENKLMRRTIANAREIYLRVQAGDYREETPPSPFASLALHIKIWMNRVQTTLKRGVE